MKPHERRKAGAYPYYKLATWSERNSCWNDGKRAHSTEIEAKAEATQPGRYRISQIDDSGRTDLAPFYV